MKVLCYRWPTVARSRTLSWSAWLTLRTSNHADSSTRALNLGEGVLTPIIFSRHKSPDIAGEIFCHKKSLEIAGEQYLVSECIKGTREVWLCELIVLDKQTDLEGEINTISTAWKTLMSSEHHQDKNSSQWFLKKKNTVELFATFPKMSSLILHYRIHNSSSILLLLLLAGERWS